MDVFIHHGVVPDAIFERFGLGGAGQFTMQQQVTDFQKVKTNIREYLERKNRKTVTLNEEKLRAERKKDKDDSEEEEKEDDEDAAVFPKSAHNDELLNIALDYVEHLRSAKTAQR